MLRGIIIIVTFMFVSVESSGHNILWGVLNKKTNELDSMLIEAINLSCERIIDEYDSEIDSEIDSETDSVKHKTIFYSTDGCPYQIIDNSSDSIKFNVTWVNLDNYNAFPKWFKKYLGNGIEINFIHITLCGDNISIAISQELIKYDKKSKSYVVYFQGYDEYRYRYFCDTGNWILYEIYRNGRVERP